MAEKVNPIPQGFHTVTPFLVVQGAGAAVEFYKNAFGAEERSRILGMDDVSIAQVELKIGDSIVLVGEEAPDLGIHSPLVLKGSPVTIHLYVKDVDTLWMQAVGAGARVLYPLQDVYWGDRYGKLVDPFGHYWSLASRRRNLTPEEIAERAKAAFGG